MSTLRTNCATCRHWAGQPGQYRAACQHPQNAGTHPACTDTCPLYASKYGPPQASQPNPATEDAAAGASLDARVREARRV